MRLSVKLCLVALALYFGAAIYGEVQYRRTNHKTGQQLFYDHSHEEDVIRKDGIDYLPLYMVSCL